MASVTHVGAQNRSDRGRGLLGRLVVVELRKSIDTRAATAVLAGFVGIGFVVLVAVLTQDPDPDLSTAAVIGLVASLAMPLVGVMSMTSEWSQRTALSTFLLVPSRGRVLVAKGLAAVVLALLLVVALLAVSVVTVWSATVVRGHGVSTEGFAELLVAIVPPALLGVLFGLAWGSLIPSTSGAIVFVILAPIVLDLGLGAALGPLAPWVSSSTVLSWLGADASFSLAVLTSTLVWYVLPMAVGSAVQMRRDVH